MEKQICIECGSAQVNHNAEWWSNWFEHWSSTYLKPLEYLRRIVHPHIARLPWNSFAVLVLKIGVKVKLLQISENLFPSDNSRTMALWNAAQSRGINITRFSILSRPTEFSIARHGRRSQAYMSMPRPKGTPSDAYFWMDNKSEMQKKLMKDGIPVPKSFECKTEQQAIEAFRKINSRVIVKPTYGSRSRHTVVGISDEQELIRAFKIALLISPWVMVQEELPGMVHRILWIGNKVVAVMRREPAYVIGNGRQTIRELVEIENLNPARQGPIFHHLPADEEVAQELTKAGLNWDSILPIGAMAILNPKVSRGNGAVNVDVTEETHPVNMELFTKIGRYINDPLVGLDFIIRDIAKPWNEQLPCGVIECNALPYVDLHSYPFAGPVRDGAGALWDLIFPQ